MKTGYFFVRLLALTLLWSLFLWALGRVVPAAGHQSAMALASTLLFVALCTGFYIASRVALRRPDPNAFTGVVFASVFIKIMAALVFLFAYKRMVQPEGKWFVGIFLMSYVVYTAFEVWFMYRMSKQQ